MGGTRGAVKWFVKLRAVESVAWTSSSSVGSSDMPEGGLVGRARRYRARRRKSRFGFISRSLRALGRQALAVQDLAVLGRRREGLRERPAPRSWRRAAEAGDDLVVFEGD